jgi:hypothetical protein
VIARLQVREWRASAVISIRLNSIQMRIILI